MLCRTCSSDNLAEVLFFEKVPLVGDFLAAPSSDVDRYDINLLFCEKCGLLQIAESIESNRLFKEYSFSSSTVPGLVTHFVKYADWLNSKIHPRTVLEVGSNDGVLLKPLQAMGIECYGLDIAENITALAKAKGLSAKSGKFEMANIKEILAWSGKVDLVTASNTFPHNSNPHDFMEAVTSVLNPGGSLALEVMYAGALMHQTQWDTLYHEHLNFHSLSSISKLLEMHGLYVNFAEIVPMHAGSLRLIASHENRTDVQVLKMLESEKSQGLHTLHSWLRFSKDAQISIDVCRDQLTNIGKSKEVWAYGASGRASMWLNICELNFIEKIIDASPLRYGRFVPGTNTPIVSPEEMTNYNPGAIFVTAWNYFDSIISQHQTYTGEWITPLPKFLRRKV
jgi:2-polyprenyl-3-methyl-5-hydroxy-6-metoxy-1,4-benzoquinol methylase